MFVPKIIFRSKKKAAGQRVKISGLRQSVFGRNKQGKPNTPLSEEQDDLSAIMRISGVATSEETDGTGERILTTKSARQLAMLVARLQRKLVAKEEEIQLLKKQNAEEVAEARQEQSHPVNTVHEASFEDNEVRNGPQDTQTIPHSPAQVQGGMQTHSDCASPSIMVSCQAPVHSLVADDLPADVRKSDAVVTNAFVDEENPAPLPVLDLRSESNQPANKRTSDISQLTNPEELSLRPNLSSEAFATFHVPSGTPVSSSDATMSATSSFIGKSSIELGQLSVGTAGKKESHRDNIVSTSAFDFTSADDLDEEQSPPAILTSMTY